MSTSHQGSNEVSQTTTELAFENSKLAVVSLDKLTADQAITLTIEATKLKQQYEAKVKEMDSAISTLQGIIIEYFQLNNQTKVSRNGRTLYLARELWPKAIPDKCNGASTPEELEAADERGKALLIEALKNDPETEHLVKTTYNSQTLRSFILNDCPEGDDGMPVMPEHLKGKLGVSEVFKAKVIKSG